MNGFELPISQELNLNCSNDRVLTNFYRASQPTVALPQPGFLVITGTYDTAYEIQSTLRLESDNWESNGIAMLTNRLNSAQGWNSAPTQTNSPQRFYRARFLQ